MAWNRNHLVRSFLGLPVPPKEFRHPEFSEAFAKLDAENNNAPRSGSGVKVHVDLSDAKEKAEALESREVFDPVVYHNSDVFTPHIVALEGDRSIYSFSTLEDWWFQLVNDASWPTLIGGEIMLEGIVIFTCGCLLTIAQMIEGDSASNATFKDNLLLSLTDGAPVHRQNIRLAADYRKLSAGGVRAGTVWLDTLAAAERGIGAHRGARAATGSVWIILAGHGC